MKNKQYNNGYRYVAYDAANGDYEEFKSLKEANDWLTDMDGEGISEEAVNGQNWIAEIQYRSVVTQIEDKGDYCTCDDETFVPDHDDRCSVCGKEERWPYPDEFDYIANHTYEKINWDGSE